MIPCYFILLLYALLPTLILLLIGFILWKVAEKNLAKRLSKIPGGMDTVNAVQLVSINYRGKIKIHGPGVYVRSISDDWGSCEQELKFQAAEAGCDIVIGVTKSGSRKRGFTFEGWAFCKE